jgi:hypothetical protein
VWLACRYHEASRNPFATGAVKKKPSRIETSLNVARFIEGERKGQVATEVTANGSLGQETSAAHQQFIEKMITAPSIPSTP